MAELKTKKTEANVVDYIATLPNDRKRSEAHTVLLKLKEITGRTPAMWGPSIIGFDRMTYKHGEMPMLAFSPRKTNMVFYVINNTAEQKDLLDKLGKHRTGVVCLYINKLADVDFEVLVEILHQSWERALKKSGND